jgi:uroporphyrinogen-III synthase
VVFSSANAARAADLLDSKSWLLMLPAFAVGEQSGMAAQAVGFTSVIAAGGDIDRLTQHMIGHLDPRNGPVLYLSGADTAGDLKGTLEKSGFAVERAVLYDAVPAEILAPEAQAALAEGKVNGVLLYSPRSAGLWLDLAGKADLLPAVRNLRHYCLSANVAAALGKDYLTSVASHPRDDDLLDLLGGAR